MGKQFEFGVIGLGVMGSALAKNIINHGFLTALFSVSEEERKRFLHKEGAYKIFCSLEAFIGAMPKPRKVFLMITAGAAVDLVIDKLLPLLDSGDIIMDGGNSFYKDTKRRSELCGKKGIEYLGIGVSGGEEGALLGPSMMVGGSRTAWNCVRDILQAIAATHEGRSCCDYMGPDGAGHYVKMVHNGIEYAILEQLAETYHFLRFVKGMKTDRIKELLIKWNEGQLSSYLLEISVRVLKENDEDGLPLVDKILDVAQQKGTGKWTVLEAIERGVYIPSIYEAQAARSFSLKKEERLKGEEILSIQTQFAMDVTEEEVENALLLSIILSYSQGLELIAAASREENWGIDYKALVSVWEDGCIIRSKLLNKIKQTDRLTDIPLLLSENFSYINALEPCLRKVAISATAAGFPMTGFHAALNYYDYYREGQMPVNFIQALRDCFGSHTYKRVDEPGDFHTSWGK